MTLCKKDLPPRVPRLGYHRDCGGIVAWHKQRTGTYLICGSCYTNGVPVSDIVAERPDYKKQQTAGVKARRSRFDIASWKDVKDPK